MHRSLGSSDSSPGEGNEGKEPILALCREWHAANAELEECCTKQRELHAALVGRIGEPHVAILRQGTPYYADDGHTIDRLLGRRRGFREERIRLKVELVRLQEAWDREADVCGLTSIEDHLYTIANHVDVLLEAIGRTPAHDFAGIAAKLDIVSAMGKEEGSDFGDFPWPLVESALADMRRLMDADTTASG